LVAEIGATPQVFADSGGLDAPDTAEHRLRPCRWNEQVEKA
jgi:hypothetical protein